MSFFAQIPSTVPSFTINSTATNAAYSLESTLRYWAGPLNRAVRISCNSADDFYVQFGSSLSVAVVGTSILVPGGLIVDSALDASQDYIATAATTSVAFNVTLGRRVCPPARQ
jgi:hypothetical protein